MNTWSGIHTVSFYFFVLVFMVSSVWLDCTASFLYHNNSGSDENMSPAGLPNLLGMGLSTSGMRISTRVWYSRLSHSFVQRSSGSNLHSTTRQDLGRRFSDSLCLMEHVRQLWQEKLSTRLLLQEWMKYICICKWISDTYRLSDSVSLLWLNLQKDFHNVSTRVNWRLTITSRTAYMNHTEHPWFSGHDCLTCTLERLLCSSLKVAQTTCKHSTLKCYGQHKHPTSAAYLTVFSVESLKGLEVF